MHTAATWHEEYIMPLANAGVKYRHHRQWGRTPLITASFECSADSWLHLTAKGNNPSAAGADGEIALHTLCQRDIYQSTKALAKKPGVNTDAQQSSNGCTPLMLAAISNNSRTVEMLIEKSADMEAQNH